LKDNLRFAKIHNGQFASEKLNPQQQLMMEKNPVSNII